MHAHKSPANMADRQAHCMSQGQVCTRRGGGGVGYEEGGGQKRGGGEGGVVVEKRRAPRGRGGGGGGGGETRPPPCSTRWERRGGGKWGSVVMPFTSLQTRKQNVNLKKAQSTLCTGIRAAAGVRDILC